jgi:hypothetical protein
MSSPAALGNDLVFGDIAAIMPIVEATGQVGMIEKMRVLPVAETGATLTSTLRYVYNFGIHGYLHGTAASDVTRVSLFKIDADTMYGDDGDDILYGLLGDDFIVSGAGNDQLSGGAGYDTVNGGTGTNIHGFDRLRDKAVAGGGQDIVRQTLDASSSSLVLGRSWISPLTMGIGSHVNNAVGTLNPVQANVVRVGAAAAPAAGVSTTTRNISPITQPAVWKPSVDVQFKKAVDASAITHSESQPVAPTGLTPLRALAFDTRSPNDIISSIRSGNIVLRVGAQNNVVPRLDLDVLLFDDKSNSFVAGGGTDHDIAFY